MSLRKPSDLGYEFQFLIGRLETQAQLLGETVPEPFQFLIGRLETGQRPDRPGLPNPRFNSS